MIAVQKRLESTQMNLLVVGDFSDDTRELIGVGVGALYKLTDKLLGKPFSQLIEETWVQYKANVVDIKEGFLFFSQECTSYEEVGACVVK